MSITNNTSAPGRKEDPWKLERPKEKKCKVTVEINPGEEGHKVRRSNQHVCKNVQVEVAPSYASSCFQEEMLPGYLESLQHDPKELDNYYKAEIANPCCWAKPPYHDYQKEKSDLNPRSTQKRKAYSKNRVPQNAAQFSSEYFPNLYTRSRSGACYDLSQLSAEDQLIILKQVFNHPAKGRNKPSLDLVNFTYEKQFIPLPQDQNDPDQVKNYFKKFKNAIKDKDIAEQRLIILLNQYYLSITFWGSEFDPDSLLVKEFESFYLSTVAKGEVGSPLFDSDLDGQYDHEDSRPLFSNLVQKTPLSQEVNSLKNFNFQSLLQHPLLAQMSNGDVIKVGGASKVLFKVSKVNGQLIIEFPYTILPQMPLKDRKELQKFKASWPQAKQFLESWMNQQLPPGIEFRLTESNKAQKIIVVASKYSKEPKEKSSLGFEDLKQENRQVLLNHFIHKVFIEPYKNEEPAHLEKPQMGRLIYSPGKRLLSESHQKQFQILEKTTKASPPQEENLETLFYHTMVMMLDVAHYEQNLQAGIQYLPLPAYDHYIAKREEQFWIDAHNIISYRHVLMGYGALHLGGHFYRDSTPSGRRTISGLALNPEIGAMYFVNRLYRWSNSSFGVFPGASLGYIYRPFFQGKTPRHSHGLKLQAVLAAAGGVALLQAGPVWVRNNKNHLGLEFSTHLTIPELHVGVGLVVGVRDLTRPGTEGSWLGLSLMLLSAGVKDTGKKWAKYHSKY